MAAAAHQMQMRRLAVRADSPWQTLQDFVAGWFDDQDFYGPFHLVSYLRPVLVFLVPAVATWLHWRRFHVPITVAAGVARFVLLSIHDASAADRLALGRAKAAVEADLQATSMTPLIGRAPRR